MKSFRPLLSSDVDIQPGFTEKRGLGFLINTTAYAGGRSTGSLAWAGIANTYYSIDPKRRGCSITRSWIKKRWHSWAISSAPFTVSVLSRVIIDSDRSGPGPFAGAIRVCLRQTSRTKASGAVQGQRPTPIVKSYAGQD